MKKGVDKITVREIANQLNLSLSDLADLIGIKKSSLYNKLNNENDWKLKDLIELSKYDDELKIQVDGEWYGICIKKMP